MAERIYLKAEDGTIEPLQEKAFDFEDELQTLIARAPRSARRRADAPWATPGAGFSSPERRE